MFDDIERTAEKIIKELNEKDNEKFAIDFAKKLKDAGIEVTKIYGPSVGPVNVRRTEFMGVQLDFFEHGKKVMESAKKYIDKLKTENEALRKQVEELDKQNTDLQDCHMKLYNDSKDEIRELKNEISKLKTELEREKNCYFKIDENFLWIKPNEERLVYENEELKAEIQRLIEKCGEVPADTAKEARFTINKGNLIISLPHEHSSVHYLEKALEEIEKDIERAWC